MSVNPLAPAWLRHPDDANALPAHVWPSSAERGADGSLLIGGVPAPALAAEFGTPLYVVDEADARSRAARTLDAFRTAFASLDADAVVYYAGKAFLCTEVVRWMLDAGLNIDVASGGELAVALAAGADPARLGLHGNNKSLAEIDRAVGVGVGAIVVDSLVEIERVAEAAVRHGRTQSVRVRINSGVHAHTHEYLATAREDQKFGIPLADAADAVARIRAHAPHLRLLGLHSHIGSQIFVVDGFLEAARRLLAVHAELLAGGDVPELNLGGGFGIAYLDSDEAPAIESIATHLAEAIGSVCAELGIPVPRIAVEPGRTIIGPAGVTLYEVGTTKDVVVTTDDGGSAVRRYVSVDGGMSDNARPALYGADYGVRLAGRSSSAEPALVRVAGKHCESGDIVVQADYLPGDVAPGDLVAVPATGAYCFSLASNYNYLARPAVVAVRDSAARVIVRGETEADLLRRDVGISEPAAPHDPAARPERITRP
ncbi:diaminopimelate decarboxylase [Yonghaparkia sp. Soil809]|uniref:diaminopimelate decarboxylase n=1 Tax=Yonghaparkia sp. Soil809 TaxID=1736417 RepID=UPI0007014EA7|nr:diaminopimelate decarboxylase [Yonghaparkia sp. Soil809]KRF31018.1 diaminopimelate decarboxylase [Yonghaparkia sp. Soil809]